MILAFDTSGAYCAATLVSAGTVLSAGKLDMARGQAEHLMPLLDDVLAQAGVDYAQLTALAVCSGPGNFTGIRISVSAARGLALSLGIPAVGVSMLDALAYGISGEALVTLDARRGAIYAQRFRDGHAVDAPELTTAQDVMAPVGAICLGEQNAQIAARIGGVVGAGDVIAAPETFARIAADRLRAGGTLDRPAPLYIRPADAALPTEAPPRMLD